MKEEKYYLLTFNDDYGDEHDVPALECMTEEEFSVWKKKPSGKLNPKFEAQNAVYQERLAKQTAFWQELQTRNLSNKPFKDYTPAEKGWYDSHKVEYVSGDDYPRRVRSFMHASLGNGGEYFGEGYQHLYLMEEFIEQGLVTVHEVDEGFYKTFRKVNLSNLSLCNVFQDFED